MFLKILYNICSCNNNVRRLSTKLSEKIVFNLAAMNQCEEGVRIIFRTQLMRIRRNLQLVRVRVESWCLSETSLKHGGVWYNREPEVNFSMWPCSSWSA